jgi:hypothetical protein
MKTQNQIIQEAYELILSEGVEPKFQVGDKVGIGNQSNYDPLAYLAMDTGTVKKIDKLGNHHVEFDNRKGNQNFDSEPKPLVHKFDAAGKSTTAAGLNIVSAADHAQKITTGAEARQRQFDMESLTREISGLKNGFGHYPKLQKDHVARLKDILDKHTEA